jgi:hypothetical protein
MLTDVPDEHIASIFRVEEIGSANQQANRLKLNGLQDVISQKMVLFKTTAVKTSNPTTVSDLILENGCHE